MMENNNKTVIYLDNSASTPIDKQVIDEMIPFLSTYYGNPSSLHSMGRYSMNGINKARQKIAKLIEAETNEIYFTSGGTESNNLAILGVLKYIKKNYPNSNEILISEIEHDSIIETINSISNKRWKIHMIPVSSDGIIDMEKFKEKLSSKTGLISIMLVNNEIGTIQPIKNLLKITKEINNKIIFHSDAVQALGKIPINVKDLGIDLLSLSSHKIYGPKGVGVLFIKNKALIEPIIFGGGQERKLRSGTENVASIVGFGKAAEILHKSIENNHSNNNITDQNKKIKKLQTHMINAILKEIPGCKLNGSKKERIVNNVNISFKGINGEDLLIKLDENGIQASTGSACSSNTKQKASHVLRALGLTYEEITGSIRFSIGNQNTKDEIEFTINTLKKIVQELREINGYTLNHK